MAADAWSSECIVSVSAPFHSSMKRWHSLACTIDDNFLVLYYDGRMVDRRSPYETKWETDSWTGLVMTVSDPRHSNRRTSIDEVRLYNRSLTADEMKLLYEREVSR